MRFLVLPIAPVTIYFHHLSRIKMLSFYRRLQRKMEKGEYSVSSMITLLFFSKTHIQASMCDRCVIMLQNLLLIFSQFCVFLVNYFVKSAHNFKAVFLINYTTLWQEFIMHNAIVVDKNSEQNSHVWPNLKSFFRSWLLYPFPLGWLSFGFNVRGIHPRSVSSYDLFE